MKNIRKALIGLLLAPCLFTSVTSSAQTKEFKVNVQWQGGDGKFLELTSSRNGQVEHLDSAIVKNGKAVLSILTSGYGSVYLSINRAYLKELVAHPGNVDVNIKNNTESDLNAETIVHGGLEQELVQQYNDVFMTGLQANMNRTNALKHSAGKTQTQRDSIVSSYRPTFDSLLHVQDYVTTKYADKEIAAYILSRRVSSLSPEEKVKQYEALSARVKASPYGLQVRKMMQDAENRQIGKQAFQFTAMTSDNKKIKLADYKGKYVLIDFWSSTCGPCLRMAPYVKQLYDTYHDKGFEIIAVSLDTKRDVWLSAMKKHEITGVQVSSLKGGDDPIAEYYGVQQMPAMVLIDPNGNNAGNVDPEKLDVKLAEIFKKG